MKTFFLLQFTDVPHAQHWSQRWKSPRMRNNSSTFTVTCHQDPNHFTHNQRLIRPLPSAVKTFANCPIVIAEAKTFQVNKKNSKHPPIKLSKDAKKFDKTKKNLKNLLHKKVSWRWKKRHNWFSSHSKTQSMMFTTKSLRHFSIRVSEWILTDVKSGRRSLFPTNGPITVSYKIFMLMDMKLLLTLFRKSHSGGFA